MPDLASSRDLRERRAKLADEMRELLSKAHGEDRSLTAEENEQFNRLDKSQEEMRLRIEQFERAEQIQVDLSLPASDWKTPDGTQVTASGRVVTRTPADPDETVTKRDVINALRAWSLPETERRTDHYKAAEKCGVSLQSSALKMNWRCDDYEEMRRRFRADGILYRATTAQSTTGNTIGGFTVPTELRERLEEALLAFGGMRQVATVLRTARGGTLNIPTVDEVASGSLVAENVAVTSDEISFAQVALGDFKYTSNMVKVSIELLQDNAVDLVAYLGRALGTRVARKLNNEFTVGTTAATSPRGITVDTFLGKNTTATGVITYGSILDLVHSVDPEYRSRPGAGFMFSDTWLALARKLIDTTGQPIWQVSARVGAPDTIVGERYTINQDIAVPATSGNKHAVYGDLGAYLIRDVMDLELLRLNERFAEKGQVAWLTFSRHDGRLLTASTANARKPVAHMANT